MNDPDRLPPIHTLSEELCLWTLNHTAKIPKSQRFTFGQRLDGYTLDLIECIAEARFRQGKKRLEALHRLNLLLEKLRVLWRLVLAQRWMSEAQSHFVHAKINEIGRMTGSWIKATNAAQKPG